MKKVISVLLCVLICIAGVIFLSGQNVEEKNDGNDVLNTDPAKKVLIIGHSLGVDSAYLFPEVMKNESNEDVIVGVLYHSGCRLSQHVEYLNNNDSQYAYFEFDTQNDTLWRRADSKGNLKKYKPGQGIDVYINDGTKAQTMQFAIQQQDWDVVILQAGVFEAAGNTTDCTLNTNDINTIADYVLENDIDKKTRPKFAWNMTWTCPSDDNLLNDSYSSLLYNNFEDSYDMYEHIALTVKDTFASAYNFEYIFPNGTAIQNALCSGLNAQDLYRDTIHATDYGRLIAAYTWYCTLTGSDINDCKFDGIGSQNRIDESERKKGKNLKLTDSQKQILVESVYNAINNPFEVTKINLDN